MMVTMMDADDCANDDNKDDGDAVEPCEKDRNHHHQFTQVNTVNFRDKI